MLDCNIHRAELTARIQSITALLDATHLSPAPPAATPGVTAPTTGTLAPTGPDVSREARGLAILLMFASYEHLMVSLCRSVLEIAASLRVGNRRLKPGLKLFAAYRQLQSLIDSRVAGIWTGAGLNLVNILDQPRSCTIVTDVFPKDGSYMRPSQVLVFCDILGLGNPGPILREVWGRLDTIVTERNLIAHGAATADQVGRNYSIADIRNLVVIWHQRWGDFLTWVESHCADRSFFRR